MPPGRWRRRPPLPPTQGTTAVCPIGEADEETAARYWAGRDEDADDQPITEHYDNDQE